MTKRNTVDDIVKMMREEAAERIDPANQLLMTYNEKKYASEVSEVLNRWAKVLEDILHGPLDEGADLAKTYKRAKSPTGTVHAVRYDNNDDPSINARFRDTIGTMCNYKEPMSDSVFTAYDVPWPQTDEPVTCKNCLRAIVKEHCVLLQLSIVKEHDWDRLNRSN